MVFSLAFPAIDPVLIQIGPLAIRWYSLAYVAGLLLGWLLVRRLASGTSDQIARQNADDFLTWATIGVILGGRLGYVLFYRPEYYLANPAEIVAVWRGGMSFHGGLSGVIVAAVLYTRKHRIPLLVFGDLLACAAPPGLLFGRIANFINGELFGRVSDVPWAMVFPHGGPYPRHPSQLYEACLEGLVLFAVTMALVRTPWITSRPGIITGAFVAGYGMARFIVEFFREPDAHMGMLSGVVTMGQLLSAPMILAGAGLAIHAVNRGKTTRRS